MIFQYRKAATVLLICSAGLLSTNLSFSRNIAAAAPSDIPRHNIDLEVMLPVRHNVSRDAGRKKVPAVAHSEKDLVIAGSMIFSATWPSDTSDLPYGIYSVSESGAQGLRVSPLHYDPMLNATCGAVMTPEGYFVTGATRYMGYYLVDHYIFDPSDWKLKKKFAGDMESMARCLAYSPADDTVYGCFLNLDGTYCFGTINVSNGQRKRIIARMNEPYVAMAADDARHLYAIDIAGNLLRLDPSTGDVENTSLLGLPSSYTTSAVYDSRRNTILYVKADDEGSALYDVDPVAGTSEMLGVFADSQQWGGIFVPEASACPGAPGWGTDYSVSFEGGDLRGVMTATAPTLLYDGSAPEGGLVWNLSLDGSVILSGECSYGESISGNISVDTPGLHVFALSFSNDAGEGPSSILSEYIGPDVPEAVKSLSVAYDGERAIAHLTWEAPAEGVNGGWFDAGALTYDIIRYPGEEIVASSVSGNEVDDVLDAGPLAVYRYGVIPVHNGIKGEEKLTAPLAVGEISLPYRAVFDKPSALDAFAVVDANGDGVTWTMEEKRCASVSYSYRQMDDWLITSPVRLQKGMVYPVSFKAWGQTAFYRERIALWMGEGMSKEDMTKKLKTSLVYPDSQPISVNVTVAEDGIYNFGLQGCSDAGQYLLNLDWIEIGEPYAQGTPAAPKFTVLKPSSDGDLNLSGRIRTPSLSVDGAPLALIDKVVVKRGDVDVAVFDNPEPNKLYNFTDNLPAPGEYTYTVMAENMAGAGASEEKKIFAGVNVPVNPSYVEARGYDGENLEISWTVPLYDVDGYLLNTSDIEYRVYDKDFLEVAVTKDKSVIVKSGVEGSAAIWYVRASTSAGLNSSWSCVTPVFNHGAPAQGVLSDAFATPGPGWVGLAVADGVAAGYNPFHVYDVMSPTGVSKDNPLSSYLSVKPVSASDRCVWISPAVKLLEGRSVATVDCHSLLDSSGILRIFVVSGGIWSEVKSFSLSEAGNGDVTLSAVLGEEFGGQAVNLAMVLDGVDENGIVLSDFSVVPLKPVDMVVKSISAPHLAVPGMFAVSVDCFNRGSEELHGIALNIIGGEDGEERVILASSELESLLPGERRRVEFSVYMSPFGTRMILKAVAGDVDGDDPEDNESSEVLVLKKVSYLPVPDAPQTNVSPDYTVITLQWDMPVNDGVNIPDGYHVWVNRKQMARVDGNSYDYILSEVEKGEMPDLAFVITALYGELESMPSQESKVTLSSVEVSVTEIANKHNAIPVEIEGKALIFGQLDSPVDVYLPDGKIVARAVRSGQRVMLSSGVYILRYRDIARRVSL